MVWTSVSDGQESVRLYQCGLVKSKQRSIWGHVTSVVTHWIRDRLDTKGPEIRTGILEKDYGRLELDLEKVAEIEIVTDDAFKV